jgi:branched-chain amino acid transport system substrate-binding protein
LYRIGVPIGLSGANSVVAPSVVQSAQLAVDEINAAGGVLGRPLELQVVDDQSGATGAQNAFDTLIFQKKVDVLISMETSAARNAALPIVAKGKTPYIYTSYYEGHSCNSYMYEDSWVPEQQVAPVIDLFVDEKKAKTFFLIGSDYAYGRGMLGFSKDYILKRGGSVVGEEYNPMDASDWTSIISKVRAAKPDALILATAGGAPNVTLTKQYKAAGIQALIGNIGVDEGTAKSMGSDAAGIYISQAYVSSLDTPENAKYLASMKAKFGDGLKTPNDLSVPEYEAIYLYKAAVETAGSTKAGDVLKALGTVSFQGPRGLIKMDKQRHAALTMNLGQVQDDGSVKVVKSFPGTNPGEQCPNL